MEFSVHEHLTLYSWHHTTVYRPYLTKLLPDSHNSTRTFHSSNTHILKIPDKFPQCNRTSLLYICRSDCLRKPSSANLFFVLFFLSFRTALQNFFTNQSSVQMQYYACSFFPLCQCQRYLFPSAFVLCSDIPMLPF